MEKLYAVFTDYEHDKVGVLSVLFGDYFVVLIQFCLCTSVLLVFNGLGGGSVVEQLSCIPEALWLIGSTAENK